MHDVAETPDGAWPEFLRHEEIVDPIDVRGIRRAMWVVSIEGERLEETRLSDETLRGGPATYPDCREEARRLRGEGASGLVAPSAALEPGASVRCRVDGGLIREPREDSVTIALFGPRPALVGFLASPRARPAEDLVGSVRYFSEAP